MSTTEFNLDEETMIISGPPAEIAAKKRLLASTVQMVAAADPDEHAIRAHVDALGALLCEWLGQPMLISIRNVLPDEFDEVKQQVAAHEQSGTTTDPLKLN